MKKGNKAEYQAVKPTARVSNVLTDKAHAYMNGEAVAYIDKKMGETRTVRMTENEREMLAQLEEQERVNG